MLQKDNSVHLFRTCVNCNTGSPLEDESSQIWAELPIKPFLGTVLLLKWFKQERFLKSWRHQLDIKMKRNAHLNSSSFCDTVLYSSRGCFPSFPIVNSFFFSIVRRDERPSVGQSRIGGITHFAYPSMTRTLRTGERLDGASAFPWRSTGRPVRRDGAVRTWRPLPSQSSRPSTGPDCSSEPSMRRPPCTDRPASFGCTTSGRRRSRACWPDSSGPFHSGGNSCQN